MLNPIYQRIEVKEGWSEVAPPGEGCRRDFARFPLQIDGGLRSFEGERRACVVEEFSAYGMRIRFDSADQLDRAPKSYSPAAAYDRGARFANDLAISAGDPIELALALPGRLAPIRARARVKRIERQKPHTEIAVHYSRTSIDAYRCMLRVSDELTKLRCIVPGLGIDDQNVLQLASRRLQGSAYEMLSRLKERLRLYGETGRDGSSVLCYLEGLSCIVEFESSIARGYLGYLADVLHSGGTKQRCPFVRSVEFDPRSMGLDFVLSNMPCNGGLSASVSHFDACISTVISSLDGAQTLVDGFVRACAPFALPAAVTAVVAEVAGEVARLEWLRLQCLLGPSNILIGG